ncbi:MAG: peptide ABC transporter substrate-binding protein [Chloroflexota bacterium]
MASTTWRVLLVGLALVVSSGVGCRPSTGTLSPTPPTSTGQGTLRLADTGPFTLDPAVAGEAASGLYIMQIFSGLVKLDEDLELTPDIAERWDKNQDGRVFTFHLRHDAKFHDGRAVKAGDFKYSWERALDPATGSRTAGTYLGDIVGAADMLVGRTAELSGVRVLDDYTLEVTIDGPKAYFLSKLSYPVAFVVDRANVEVGGSWWQRPNGTGPFKLKEWRKDELFVLSRNDDFYGEKAKLKEVAFELWSGSSMVLYQSGEIDVAYTGGAYMGLVTDPNNALSKELRMYPELSFYYIGFNASRPPFDDVNVRRAFSHAVDKDRVISLAMQDAVSVAYGVVPPGLPGYDSSVCGSRFDPQKAREFIAASRYGDVTKLPPITLTTAGWGGNISGLLGGVIEEWRRNLGVEVRVRQLEPEVFFYFLREEKDEMYDLGWVADYPDPQNFLDILFRTGAENNAGEYSSTVVDKLLDEAAIEQDPAARLRMYLEAENTIVEDAAVLPLFFGRNYVLVKPYVKGYSLTPLGYPLLSKVSVER